MIRHVVLMKFQDDAHAPEAKHRLEALPAQIPQLLSLEVALDLVHSPASYDLCLITTHASLQTLSDYQTHPVHEEFGQWLRPLLTGRVVVDSEL